MKASTVRILCPGLIAFSLAGLLSTACNSTQTNKPLMRAETEIKAPKPEKVDLEKLSEANPPSASAVIAAYNSRKYGSPGWRRVMMELYNDDELTRSFEIINLWRAYEGEVSMLFLLREPKGLSGTNYLLREEIGNVPDIQVHLFLPAGERRVLALAPGSFNQGLLGSDFSYNDVRMLLPVSGYRYNVIGQGKLARDPVWIIESEPSEALTREMCSWSKARLYFARNFSFLLGADYYGPPLNRSEPAILKSMRVERYEEIEGVWTATRMIMTSDNNRWTSITLKEAKFNAAGIGAELFSAERLPSLADKVQQNWTPETSPR